MTILPRCSVFARVQRIQAIKSALRKKAQRLQVTASQLRQSLHQMQKQCQGRAEATLAASS